MRISLSFFQGPYGVHPISKMLVVVVFFKGGGGVSSGWFSTQPQVQHPAFRSSTQVQHPAPRFSTWHPACSSPFALKLYVRCCTWVLGAGCSTWAPGSAPRFPFLAPTNSAPRFGTQGSGSAPAQVRHPGWHPGSPSQVQHPSWHPGCGPVWSPDTFTS